MWERGALYCPYYTHTHGTQHTPSSVCDKDGSSGRDDSVGEDRTHFPALEYAITHTPYIGTHTLYDGVSLPTASGDQTLSYSTCLCGGGYTLLGTQHHVNTL